MASRATNYANALLDSWDGANPHEQEHVIDRFVKLLRADRALPLVPNIISAIEALLAERIKQQIVMAEFAHKPSGHQLESLKRFKVTQASESYHVIGGFKVTGRNKIIDASIQGGLSQARQILSSE